MNDECHGCVMSLRRSPGHFFDHREYRRINRLPDIRHTIPQCPGLTKLTFFPWFVNAHLIGKNGIEFIIATDHRQ
jgi:hypothetical protein